MQCEPVFIFPSRSPIAISADCGRSSGAKRYHTFIVPICKAPDVDEHYHNNPVPSFTTVAMVALSQPPASGHDITASV